MLPVYFWSQARHQSSIDKRTLKKYKNFMTIDFQVIIKNSMYYFVYIMTISNDICILIVH